MGKVQAAKDSIQKVQLRKELAEAKIHEFMTIKKMEANMLITKLEEVQATLPHVDDDETAAVANICISGHDALLKLCGKDLPALEQDMVKEIDLNEDNPENIRLKPNAEKLVENGSKECETAEVAVREFLNLLEKRAQEAAEAAERARKEAEE